MQHPRLILFDVRCYDREAFRSAAAHMPVQLTFQSASLSLDTVALAQGHDAVCAFVNDTLDAAVLTRLHDLGVKLLAMRCAGYNNVDVGAAQRLGLAVVRVPAYSPHAVAEHATALVLSLNRKIHRAYARTRELNFSLEGLVGFDLYGKTVGVIGTGQIGRAVAQIFAGFGCRVLLHDVSPHMAFAAQVGGSYVALAQLYAEADIISLHVPLSAATYHLIDSAALAQMKPHVMIINTGRGALIDSRALVKALKAGRVGGAGLDVYEEEGIYFSDHSGDVLQDDLLARLLTFPNVLITAHQAFLTHEALHQIAKTTLESVGAHAAGKKLVHQLCGADAAASGLPRDENQNA